MGTAAFGGLRVDETHDSARGRSDYDAAAEFVAGKFCDGRVSADFSAGGDGASGSARGVQHYGGAADFT